MKRTYKIKTVPDGVTIEKVKAHTPLDALALSGKNRMRVWKTIVVEPTTRKTHRTDEHRTEAMATEFAEHFAEYGFRVTIQRLYIDIISERVIEHKHK